MGNFWRFVSISHSLHSAKRLMSTTWRIISRTVSIRQHFVSSPADIWIRIWVNLEMWIWIPAHFWLQLDASADVWCLWAVLFTFVSTCIVCMSGVCVYHYLYLYRVPVRCGCFVLFTGWFHRCIRLEYSNASLMHRWNQPMNKTTHPVCVYHYLYLYRVPSRCVLSLFLPVLWACQVCVCRCLHLYCVPVRCVFIVISTCIVCLSGMCLSLSPPVLCACQVCLSLSPPVLCACQMCVYRCLHLYCVPVRCVLLWCS